MIFRIPLVRLRAYQEELLLAQGEEVVRKYPELPEEKIVARLLKREARKSRKSRKSREEQHGRQ